jgi:hypothetical protein
MLTALRRWLVAREFRPLLLERSDAILRAMANGVDQPELAAITLPLFARAPGTRPQVGDALRTFEGTMQFHADLAMVGARTEVAHDLARLENIQAAARDVEAAVFALDADELEAEPPAPDPEEVLRLRIGIQHQMAGLARAVWRSRNRAWSLVCCAIGLGALEALLVGLTFAQVFDVNGGQNLPMVVGLAICLVLTMVVTADLASRMHGRTRTTAMAALLLLSSCLVYMRLGILGTSDLTTGTLALGLLLVATTVVFTMLTAAACQYARMAMAEARSVEEQHQPLIDALRAEMEFRQQHTRDASLHAQRLRNHRQQQRARHDAALARLRADAHETRGRIQRVLDQAAVSGVRATQHLTAQYANMLADVAVTGHARGTEGVVSHEIVIA